MEGKAMIYGSVCSGIEAATVAWQPLGWKASFFAEIERYPSEVLKHHYPQVPNAGDFTKIEKGNYEPINLLVGGTPCQDFSVAGLRAGMDGKRGQLTVEFARLAGKLRPEWVVWENVPGVLSIDEGRAFGTFLGILGQFGYGVAYRVLDAQHFGVPQRRRRVFVVGHLGDWRRAAAVLFERHSLSGDTPPRRKARKGIAGGVEVGPSGSRLTDVTPTLDARCKDGFIRNQIGGGVLHDTEQWPVEIAPTLNAHFGDKMGLEDQHIQGGGGCLSPAVTAKWAKGTGGPSGDECQNLIATEASSMTPTRGGFFDEAVAYDTRNGMAPHGNMNGETISPTLRAKEAEPQLITHAQAVAFRASGQEGFTPSEVSPPIAATDGGGSGVPTICFDSKASGRNGFGVSENTSPTLRAMSHALKKSNAGGQVAVAIPIHDKATRHAGHSIDRDQADGNGNGFGVGETGDPMYTVTTGDKHAVATAAQGTAGGDPNSVTTSTMAVRRLTPRECERLQGFPGDYTKINEKSADGPRYKALGNSMAVPVMRWIGERIEMVQKATRA